MGKKKATNLGRNSKEISLLPRSESFEPFTLLTFGAEIETNNKLATPRYNEAAERFRTFLALLLYPKELPEATQRQRSFAIASTFLIHLSNGTGSPPVRRASVECGNIFIGHPGEGVTFAEPERITPEYIGMNVTHLGFDVAHHLYDIGIKLGAGETVQNTNIDMYGSWGKHIAGDM